MQAGSELSGWLGRDVGREFCDFAWRPSTGKSDSDCRFGALEILSLEHPDGSGLTIKVNRPSSGPNDERRRGSTAKRERGGNSLLGPG